MTLGRILGVGAIAAVLGGVVFAFITIGSPQHARLTHLDALRSRALEAMALRIDENYGGKGKHLPAHLPRKLFESPQENAISIRDPQTNAPYAYERRDRGRYVLCATFALASNHVRPGSMRYQRRWPHPAGHTCYLLDVHRMSQYPSIVSARREP